MAVLEIKDLSVNYGSTLAVSGVSLTVDGGEYVCLTGPNGSGKTSLLKAVLGIVPVSSGSIKLSLPRGQVAWLSQHNPADRDFPATAWEVTLMGRQLAPKEGGKGRFRLPFYTGQDRRAAKEAMRALAVYGLRDRHMSELSGGQAQRVLLARALCGNARLIMLDEPCAGLDAESSAGLYTTLRELNREMGVAILMVSHDLDEPARSAGRIVYINRSVDFDGSPEEYRRFSAEPGRDGLHI